MISSKPEHFKEGPGQVRGSRPGPPLSWHSNFCIGLRGKSKTSAPNKKISPLWGMANSQPVWTALEGQVVPASPPPPSQATYVHARGGKVRKGRSQSCLSVALCLLLAARAAQHSGQQQLSSYGKLGKYPRRHLCWGSSSANQYRKPRPQGNWRQAVCPIWEKN